VLTAGSKRFLRDRSALKAFPATMSIGHSPPIKSSAARISTATMGASVTPNVRLLALISSIAVAGRQIHDANIVATMQAHGIGRLLTHNTADFARFAAIITVEPLVMPP
jgi:predicted nucleic acid-binding protein